MKRITRNILFILLLASAQFSFAGEPSKSDTSAKKEEFKPSGKINATIFANAATSFDTAISSVGINLERAYFGYAYQLTPEFSAYVKLDIAQPSKAVSIETEIIDDAGNSIDSLSVGSSATTEGFYAFLKNAGFQYKIGDLSVDFGLIDQNVFKYQEKGWGHRYVAKSFMDEAKFATSADLGIYAKYKINKFVTVDFSLSNGEGYKSVQEDKAFKTGVGVIVNPIEKLTLRSYFDNYQTDGAADATQTIVGYLEYKIADKATVGFEYDTQSNYKNKGKDQVGMSGFASYAVTKKIEIFGRYDLLADAFTKLYGGVQYAVVKNINLALDYQGYTPEGGDVLHSVFAHVEVKF